ncbi:MAG: hypothetical protein KBG40_08210 [Bacteroidales bacterium]|nr:hypothetical protein [Bacteroidales bacterium]
MKNLIIWLVILTLFTGSCKKLPYELGECNIIYDNISILPSNSITVTVITRISDSTWTTDHTTQYTLTPKNNLLRLYFDDGYSFKLIIPELRQDSIYDVKVIRNSNLNRLEYYSFKFNDKTYDSNNHIIHIQF